MFFVTICTSYFLASRHDPKDARKWEIMLRARSPFDRGNAIGRPYISSGGGGRFPRAQDDGIFRGWLLYYRRAALNLRVRGPNRFRGASRRSLLHSPGVAVELLPAIIHYAYLRLLVLARVKLLENQLLLRYCL